MYYAIMFSMGLFAGSFCVYLLFMEKQRKLTQQKLAQDAQVHKITAKQIQIKEFLDEVELHKENKLQEIQAAKLQIEQYKEKSLREIEEAKTQFEREKAKKLQEVWDAYGIQKEKNLKDILEAKEQLAQDKEKNLREIQTACEKLDEKTTRLDELQKQFEARLISYDELVNENAILKQDLQGIDVNLRKLQLDRQRQKKKQELLDQQIKDLGTRYLNENVKWIGSAISANNYSACKQRMQDVIKRCREIGFEITEEKETSLLADLKQEFEKAVRAAIEREEQARIKSQIREEEKLKKEVERELKQLDRERAAIQAALEKALAEAKDQHSEEVERLRARLAEAEEKSKRAISQAQLTKSGHVYVISNIGAFGENVFKIGMTRRLEPEDRVDELSSASVPFPYDVHMMISSNDAPKLENEMHRAFHRLRVNKANPRKEFFRVGIEDIRNVVEKSIGGEALGKIQYVADPEALEYRQSLTMTDEDMEFIETVYEEAEENGESVVSGE